MNVFGIESMLKLFEIWSHSIDNKITTFDKEVLH